MPEEIRLNLAPSALLDCPDVHGVHGVPTYFVPCFVLGFCQILQPSVRRDIFHVWHFCGAQEHDIFLCLRIMAETHRLPCLPKQAAHTVCSTSRMRGLTGMVVSLRSEATCRPTSRGADPRSLSPDSFKPGLCNQYTAPEKRRSVARFAGDFHESEC